MRLLQIIPTTARGGNEEYALTVAREAVTRGWQVTAAFPALPGTATLAADYAGAGASTRALAIHLARPIDWNHRGSAARRIVRTMWAIRRVRPNLIHLVLPWPEFGFAPALACALRGVPTLVVFQLVGTGHRFNARTGRAYLWAKQRRQRWVAVSDQNRRALAAAFEEDSGEIDLIYNGAPPAAPAEAGAREAVRAELGLPASAILSVSVGRLDGQKGFDLLMHAMPFLAREFPAFHMAIAGDGPEAERLARMAAERKVTDRVHLLGRRSDVPRLLAAADLFLFPTRMEGHPFALVEAMAAGVPVVSSSASGIPELVTDGETGRLFRPDDPCDLLDAARRALADLPRMRAMAAAGRAVATRFTRERMLNETFERFALLTAERRGA